MDARIPNIGPKQRRHRLLRGAVILVAAGALATALAVADAHAAVRALVALPLYGAMLGFVQYREKT
ncbi:MAG: hypothetical protein KFH98_07100 [Gemmatimonadetes bacterium]|nr:hypothetical protein [Gemmatimonadota bacterium]